MLEYIVYIRPKGQIQYQRTGGTIKTHEELKVGKSTTHNQLTSYPATIDKIEHKNGELRVYLTRKDNSKNIY
jgi:hypothetical protein